MKILIIGGTGLISTPLTHFLLQRGDDVTLYNRGATHSRVPPNTRMIRGDRRQYAAFENEMHASGSFDCVIDMVGYDPEDAHSLVRAFKGRIGQLIFCSTVDVYRKPASRYPYTEAEIYGGLNTYATNKVSCEKTLLAAHDHTDLPVTIIRPAYTYGESRGLLYPVGSSGAYLDRIRQGKPLIVHGDGSSLWVACHTDDVARAFVGATGNSLTFGRSYHVTGEEWMTWNQYHQGVAHAIGAPSPKLVHIPTDTLAKMAPQRALGAVDNFQFNNVFDNSAAKRDLGFQYTITWHAGVQRAVEWLQQNRVPVPPTDGHVDDLIIDAWRQLEQVVADKTTSLRADS
jgi:nucleoside-diphosphate-sugar epimerase